MGATGWSYFTPYRSFTNQALHELRRRVFENREYEGPAAVGEDIASALESTLANFPEHERPRKLKEFKVAAIVARAMQKLQTGSLKPDAMREILAMATQLTQGNPSDSEFDATLSQFETRFAQMMDTANAKPKPKSIEALLKKCAQNGTHSILDIDHIADQPEFGAASPMPLDRVEKIYGSSEPTHQDIQNAQFDDDELDRWQAWYVIVYKDGRPNEIFFTGSSGD